MTPTALTRIFALCLAGLALTSPAFAQKPDSPDSQTMQALLSEVRQLRAAIERAMSLQPRIQITLERMQVEQRRIEQLSKPLEDVRRQLGDHARFAGQQAAVEAQLFAEQDPNRRRQLEDTVKAIKAEAERRSVEDVQLRAGESELLSALQAEQAKMNELSDRLDKMDQSLEPK
jgi:DNA repair exonuclease SbcCD ATPase subunit